VGLCPPSNTSFKLRGREKRIARRRRWHVTPTSPFMRVTGKDTERGMVWEQRQRCCACSWGAYVADNVCATQC
jgi:hypothetical protein